MSTNTALAHPSHEPAARRIAFVRAIFAVAWAVAVAIAAGDASGELSTGLALLLTVYPVIDVVASLAEAAHGGGAATRLRINAVVSGIAVAGLAIAAFASDVSGALLVFGAWAVVSGLMQLFSAVQCRRTGSRELPMLISGGLSAIAGTAFIVSSRADDPKLGQLAGYAALGALFFVVWAYRGRTSA